MIRDKLLTLQQVGLGYIHIGQQATTLSGGEAQRVKLAKELSRRATGRTLYILDEPTTGLHFEDVRKLLEVLHRLVEGGNTVLVIEHNLEVIKTADWVLDMGPDGGTGGGRHGRRGPARGDREGRRELHRPVPRPPAAAQRVGEEAGLRERPLPGPRTALAVSNSIETITGRRSAWRFRPHYHAGDEIVTLLAGRTRLRLPTGCRDLERRRDGRRARRHRPSLRAGRCRRLGVHFPVRPAR